MNSEGGWHRSVTGVVRRTLQAAFDDNIPFLASALSFDLLLTAIPFVVLLLAVAGYLVQHQAASQQIELHQLLERFLMRTLRDTGQPDRGAGRVGRPVDPGSGDRYGELLEGVGLSMSRWDIEQAADIIARVLE